MTSRIDLRDDDLTLLDFVPESIKSDPEIVALSHAIDPELRAVAESVIEANILPRIDDLPEWVLDELAWAFNLDTLMAWSALDGAGQPVNAPIEGKRAILRNIFDLRKRAGTRYAVRRVFDLLGVTGRLLEWFVDTGPPYTYRLELTVDENPLTAIQTQAVVELAKRFAPVRSRMRAFTIVSERGGGPVTLRAASTGGHFVTIPFGGP